MRAAEDFDYYEPLAKGALYLAGQATDPSERIRHLAMAAKYHMQSKGHPWPPRRRSLSDRIAA
jgi:hypothetical protein